jgi:phosphoribosyl-AMP cyclohydrolase
LVDQLGVACHTGRRSCFYTALRNGKTETVAEVLIDPKTLYGS